ncbi:sigma-70 family RNA polymerase sigma factor [Ilumatobacter sp.]|uniref:sigma-70 family RNA polymerase sigma factor n=1 Tax=Ilumatobacter sp. TaxID=1967498 RepID=UPI003B52816F
MMDPLPDDRFAELFRGHHARLVALARRVLGDLDEAQDAAQEALLALRTDPVASRGDDDVAAWLSRVVTNGSLNRLRTRRRADARAQIVGARDRALPLDATADAVVGADERERVRASLASLPERQAAALLLRHTGHSYREIAGALGVAEGSVGVLLARGERAFRGAYEEMDR